jgi:carboxyl-terminal processing protease
VQRAYAEREPFMMKLRSIRALRASCSSIAAAALLAACGGGDDGAAPVVPPPESCSVAAQQAWLGDYMDAWYFWYQLSPRPSAGGFDSVQSYFQALLYTGSSPNFPSDRWSRTESTESFNRFFGDGATLAYGLSVNGIEAVETAGTPLYVRYVEPQSNAAAQGVRRGDQVISVNGRSAADLVANNDFAVLSPAAAGDRLQLVLRSAGVDRNVTVTAGVFNLTPVGNAAVYTSIGGRRLGYLMVKDMISQAQGGLESAFASFRSQGVQDVILDLRYNGGGLVSMGGTVASYVAGARGAGRNYAALLYNDKRAASNNQSFAFSNPANAVGLARVFVLMGPRTCSASEQVINGLRGVGVEVIGVGDTSCGKPVGFLPSSQCGTTYSVVNFESVNALNQGRYWNGFDATCPVSEDWTIAQGAGNDPLVSTAAWWADTGTCAPTAAQADGQRRALAARRALARERVLDERSEMIPR